MSVIFNWNVVWNNLAAIRDGALVTLWVSFVAIALGLALGAALATVRMSRVWILRVPAIVYVEVIRATPLLVQLYVIFFVLAKVVKLDNLAAGLVGLTLYSTAYCSEILRAGFESVPAGQQLAGKSLGFSSWQIFRYVSVPQALKNIGPPLTNQFIDTTLSSSIISVIGGVELTQTATSLVGETFHPFEIYITVAIVYLAITLAVVGLFGHFGGISGTVGRLLGVLLGRRGVWRAATSDAGEGAAK